jgi:hypothetical protein
MTGEEAQAKLDAAIAAWMRRYMVNSWNVKTWINPPHADGTPVRAVAQALWRPCPRNPHPFAVTTEGKLVWRDDIGGGLARYWEETDDDDVA